MAAPGRASAVESKKKRKPVANAASGSTPSLPRKLTKNVSRRANPLMVNGTSITRKSSGPITKNGRGERSTPTAFAAREACCHHDGELDPEVGADVVLPVREHEAEGSQHERREAAEHALEQHRA